MTRTLPLAAQHLSQPRSPCAAEHATDRGTLRDAVPGSATSLVAYHGGRGDDGTEFEPRRTSPERHPDLTMSVLDHDSFEHMTASWGRCGGPGVDRQDIADVVAGALDDVARAVMAGGLIGTISGAAIGGALGGAGPAFTGVLLPESLATCIGGALVGAPIGALAGTITIGGGALIVASTTIARSVISGVRQS